MKLNEVKHHLNTVEEYQAAHEAALEAIKVGERSRILFEIMLSEIGLTMENNFGEVWEKLAQVQKEYEEALNMLATVMRDRRDMTIPAEA